MPVPVLVPSDLRLKGLRLSGRGVRFTNKLAEFLRVRTDGKDHTLATVSGRGAVTLLTIEPAWLAVLSVNGHRRGVLSSEIGDVDVAEVRVDGCAGELFAGVIERGLGKGVVLEAEVEDDLAALG